MARDFDYWHREAVERGKPDPVRWAQKKVDQQREQRRKDRERGAMRSPYPIRPARTPVRPATPWDAGHTAEPMGNRLTQPEPPAFGVPMLDAWWEIQKERTRDAQMTQGLPLDPLPELTAKEHRNAWRYEQTLERKRQAELRKRQRRRTALRVAPVVVSYLAALVGFFMLALHLFF